MEKLIKLLNEWERERVNHNMKEFIPYGESSFSNLSVERITSKKYWFIKQLVVNNKIDREKFWNSETKSSKYSDFELSYDTPREDYTNILLMELAISDTPIEDLLLYLK